jgi:hypothetical protein
MCINIVIQKLFISELSYLLISIVKIWAVLLSLVDAQLVGIF